MDQQIRKTARMPRTLIAKIRKVTRPEGSTFSQFMRRAAINELKRRQRETAA